MKYLEENKKIRYLEICLICIFLLFSFFSMFQGFKRIFKDIDINDLEYVDTIEMIRDFDSEDYDEDSTICDITYIFEDKKMVISYSYEDYLKIETETIAAYLYKTSDDIYLCFKDINPSLNDIKDAYQYTVTLELSSLMNLGIALLILSISLGIILVFSKAFTTYEKVWFISIMALASIFAYLFPEESANGVNGIVIMLLYLLDTFLNILCELLISKQSRYNFLVSVAVEICEILICVVLMYRFATMASTLFFWLPIDIISFINWSKHKDEEEDELTVVRKLKGYQEILIILGVVIWTILVGYLLSGIDIKTDFLENRNIVVIIAYLDACASAVGICNGLFILFRLQEQWIAWYICALLEAIINILSGQYVLLVLKLGYLTNTTYGYIKWNKYIKNHKEDKSIL